MKFFLFLSLFLSLNSFSQSVCIKANMNFTGFCTEYCFNDSTTWVKEFENGVAIGIWMNFDKNGNLRQQLRTELKKDSLVEIYQFVNPELLLEPKIEELEEIDRSAEFPGGMGAFTEYMQKNLVYPDDAKEMGLQGKCYVKFIVETDGQISNVTVVKGVQDCPQCDKEVIRFMRSMPKWLPGVEKGKRVRTWCQLPFNFYYK